MCPIDSQPRINPVLRELLKLWRRMRDTGALPEAGGLLDQPEWIMTRMDWITDEFNKRQPAPGGPISPDGAGGGLADVLAMMGRLGGRGGPYGRRHG